MTEPRVTTFFIDRCLGSVQLAASLRKFGIAIEVHDAHFPPDAQDEEWLLEVGKYGWIVLTKDAKIAKRRSERLAVASANVKMFVLVSQDLSGEDMIAVFRAAFPAMQAFARKHSAPFIAKVYRDGKVSAWKEHQELLAELAAMTEQKP